jgi:hypothetical protein
VQGSDLFFDQNPQGSPPPPVYGRPGPEGLWGAGDRITWVSALILMLSTLMDWYAGSGPGVKLAVIGWHTGLLGKLVFFIGFALLAIAILRAYGFDLPAPEGLVVLALGALATVFVLIRVIHVPDAVMPADTRGIGLWVSLLAALGVIAGGLLRSAEDL